jgi:hypothetical protein
MAYARLGFGSDVWVFSDGKDLFCYGPNEETLTTADAHKMLTHLRALEAQGIMTGAAITRLTEEIGAGKWQ